MKKEVSDHLSRAFFETKAKKKEDNSFIFFLALTLGFSVVFVLGAIFLSKPRLYVVPSPGQYLRVQKHDGPYVLAYDFTGSGAKTASLAIELPRVDFSRYKSARFSARLIFSDSPARGGAVKICLSSARQENGCVYVSDAGPAWKKFDLDPEVFLKISDWSAQPMRLVLTLEEWNISSRKGELLVDEIEFLAN